jgi:hypothetical protein
VRGQRWALVVVLGVGAVLSLAQPASACNCPSSRPIEAEIAAAEVAFVGDVVESRGDGTYRVAVANVLKGSVPGSVDVRAQTGGPGTCGVRVAPGPILYVGPADLRFDACSPTRAGLAPAEESGGPATASPEDGNGSAGPALAWAAAGAVVGAAGTSFLLAFRRRRALPPR